MWNFIVSELQNHPQDIQTVPLHGQGKWFYAYSDGNDIWVTNSKTHIPSCKISKPRKLKKERYEVILQLYRRRCKGEAVSQEATSVTVHQVYWYGIFSKFDVV